MTAMNWTDIDTVLLDMDGTLLDLRYDNHFWREHLPRRWAEDRGLAPEEAQRRIYERYEAVKGTMAWYCTDHWTRELGIDVAGLKREIAHLIAVRPGVHAFLAAVRASGRRAVIVTNAHTDSLALKLERTALDAHLDAVISAHTIGLPKEDTDFWTHLQRLEPFEPAHTLFIDDNVDVLDSARRAGIANLLCVAQPDSSCAARSTAGYLALECFSDIAPAEGDGRAPRTVSA